MKSHLFQIAFLLILIASISCSKKQEAGDDPSAEWPEMESFHMVMAEAFHPYKDSANLAPAKKLAEEMALEAAKWQAASLPEKVNNDEVKALLEKLKTDTRALADAIAANTPDEEIGKSLTSLHDNFHSLMEAWHGGKHRE
jgi:hypothetical protein